MLMLGYFFKRAIDRVSRIETALSTHSEALAKLIQSDTDRKAVTDAHEKSIQALDRTTAVLQDRLNRHERWSEQEHERLDKGPKL